jgi:hypothetical protein
MTKSSSKKPELISLFSGCGGLDLGIHLEGYDTIWANDFSEWACDSFRNYFGDVIREGDITQINPYTDKTIPSSDLILGGFPCQDFSVIWKQPGLDGKRGGLYRHFLEFVDAKKPKGSFYCYVKCPKGTADGVKFKNAADAAKFFIEKALISVVPWDDAGSYLRISVTFEAASQVEEEMIIGEMKRRLKALNLVF